MLANQYHKQLSLLPRMTEHDNKPETLSSALESLFNLCVYPVDCIARRSYLVPVDSELVGPLMEKFGDNKMILKEVVNHALRATVSTDDLSGSEEHF